MTPLKSNKILSKIVEYGDHLSGHSARRLKTDFEALRRHQHTGLEGVPQSTINRVGGLSDAASSSSTKTRLNTIAGTIIGGTAGFLGIHKYHQNKDNRIMERIDKMYNKSYN